MKELIKVIWAYIVRDALMSVSYRLNFVMQIISIFISLISMYFMTKLIGHNMIIDKYGGFLPFSVIGLSMTSYFTTGYSSVSSAIRNEQMMGTLESVLMTPAKLSGIVVASSGWNFLWTTLTSTLTIVTASLLFHIHLQGSAIAAGLFLLLTTLTFSCVGVVSASFVMIFKRGDPLSFVMGTVSYMLGGVLFPPNIFPSWMQKMSNLLPITHGLTGLREILLRGVPFTNLLPQFLILLIFVSLGVPLSLFCFRKAVCIACREGSLLHY